MKTTHTSRAKKSGVTKVAGNNSWVLSVNTTTSNILAGSYFPNFQGITNIQYIVMAIWALESSLRIIMGEASDSRHFTSSKGSSFGIEYAACPLYRNFMKVVGLTPEQKNGAEDGWWAQAIGGTMGAYFIKGSRQNLELRAKYGDILDKGIAEFGPMEVSIGTRFRSLFTTGKTQHDLNIAIFQGLLLLYQHFGWVGGPNAANKQQALLQATGGYVGKGEDGNGYTGLRRIMDIRNPNNPHLRILADNGIVPLNLPTLQLVGNAVIAKKNKSTGTVVASNDVSKSNVTGGIAPPRNC